jgi:hypothetical protein
MVERGSRLELVDPGGRTSGLVVVEEVWAGPLGAVPAIHLELARDGVCRTFSGLQAILTSARGEQVGPADEIHALVLRDIGTEIHVPKLVTP